VGLLQVSTPERLSLPLYSTLSAFLNQPFAFGAGVGILSVTCGFVPSYLKPKLLAGLWFPARSVQVPETEALASSGVL
jgi:hypothetical protein